MLCLCKEHNGGGDYQRAGAGDAPPGPPVEQYDPTVYQEMLQRGMRDCVRKALNGFEDTLAATLEHVGSVLDARIADAQLAARPASDGSTPAGDDGDVQHAVAEAGSDEEAAAQRRAWAVFALLRQRAALGVRSAPPPVLETAAPLRRPVLDFSERVTGLLEKGPVGARLRGSLVEDPGEAGVRSDGGSDGHAARVAVPQGAEASEEVARGGMTGHVVGAAPPADAPGLE